jgi:hypothetical protein
MKLFTGWVMSAGLVFAAGGVANAQMPAPYWIGSPRYTVVSDVGGPYAAMPPEAPGPGYGPPTLLPAREVYTILRESGFSPLGIPQQRGLFYTIAVIDRGGDDGRLVIDARTGRIIRFMPAYRMGNNFNEDMVTYGPAGPLPPISNMRGVPRPPASVPHVASRTPLVPLPKASPPHADEIKPLAAAKSADKPAVDKSVADKPAVAEPAQQSAAVQAGPSDAPSRPQAAVPIVEAKPTAPIQATQEMPKMQGLE